jgi:hypothetical protein
MLALRAENFTEQVGSGVEQTRLLKPAWNAAHVTLDAHE